MNNTKSTYWQNAEKTNGRLAMMGFFALVVNYGLFVGLYLDSFNQKGSF